MDRESLVEMIVEKDKRIEDLERFVEDQRRLRLQDASQVEQKAAKIKEWVANKLRELENQNKQLREQNRRQKATVESLTSKLNSLSPMSSLRRSPVYDCVTVEQLSNHPSSEQNKPLINTSNNNNIPYTWSSSDQSNTQVPSVPLQPQPPPPPPPLHQSDRWELYLYNLAEQSFSTIMQQQHQHAEDVTDENASDRDYEGSRRPSSSSTKNDLISLVMPSFTTIDGDQVVENIDLDIGKDIDQTRTITSELNSSDHDMQPLKTLTKNFKKVYNDLYSSNEVLNQPRTPNLFYSPLRARSNKDNILRTQSVRKNPAPEKLYDFISADLVKRGYLIKPKALKNHSRWFVLKNFTLHSYKNDSEETAKAIPSLKLKLEPSFQVSSVNHPGDSNFAFKITYHEKTLQLIAESPQDRDEWIRILTVAINMSDIEFESLSKQNSTFEGFLSFTRHGHTRKCHATLVSQVLFFLKSLTDPTPISYVLLKESRIREITDNFDHDFDDQEPLKSKSNLQYCSLAIYPRFSMTPDPFYITLGSQQDTDKWFYFLSMASGVDQWYGTHFERTLVKLMINNSLMASKTTPCLAHLSESGSICPWRDHSVMLYSDRPISHPLTSLPNETLRVEAIEMFKSILLFTRVPLESNGIDYHVCLLQNSLNRFLKHPELRNEFFAQLIKQSTYVLHRCNSPKLSNSSSGCSSINHRSSDNSLSRSSNGCQFVTNTEILDNAIIDRNSRYDIISTTSQSNSQREKSESLSEEYQSAPPSQSELLQVMQILAVAVSLYLPRGRLQFWLMDHLNKFANPDTSLGKYALYTMNAISRTFQNGTRENVPSRMEIISILLRNPHDHSNPHSLPVSFSDGFYLVVGADGSTTVEEFMDSMSKHISIRHSLISDFYLFADDPSGTDEWHILEPQRKVLDVVGWWEQVFRRNNSGRFENTRVIKLICKKRLLFRLEPDETHQERLLIVHQMNRELIHKKLYLDQNLIVELAALVAQLNYGDYDHTKDFKLIKCMIEKISSSCFNDGTNRTAHRDNCGCQQSSSNCRQIASRWQELAGRSAQDCVRVFLNCMRRLKISTTKQ